MTEARPLCDCAYEAAVICAAAEVCPGAGSDLSNLLSLLGGATDLLPTAHRQVAGRHNNLLIYIRSNISSQRIDRLTREFSAVSAEIKFAASFHPGFPRELRDAYDSPPYLFILGSVVQGPRISIVGTRKPVRMEEDAVREATRLAVSDGFQIVSGLAVGVDSLAHSTCLSLGGNTIAVLGHGLKFPTQPQENSSLARRIAGAGGIVSHFPLWSPATASTYVARNAIISGLSPISIAIGVGRKSGTRTEVEFALAQGRRVILLESEFKRSPWLQAFAWEYPSGVEVVSSTMHLKEILLRELGR